MDGVGVVVVEDADDDLLAKLHRDKRRPERDALFWIGIVGSNGHGLCLGYGASWKSSNVLAMWHGQRGCVTSYALGGPDRVRVPKAQEASQFVCTSLSSSVSEFSVTQ